MSALIYEMNSNDPVPMVYGERLDFLTEVYNKYFQRKLPY